MIIAERAGNGISAVEKQFNHLMTEVLKDLIDHAPMKAVHMSFISYLMDRLCCAEVSSLTVCLVENSYVLLLLVQFTKQHDATTCAAFHRFLRALWNRQSESTSVFIRQPLVQKLPVAASSHTTSLSTDFVTEEARSSPTSSSDTSSVSHTSAVTCSAGEFGENVSFTCRTTVKNSHPACRFRI